MRIIDVPVVKHVEFPHIVTVEKVADFPVVKHGSFLIVTVEIVIGHRCSSRQARVDLNPHSLRARKVAAMVQNGNPFIDVLGTIKKMLKLIVEGKQDNDTSIMDDMTTRSLTSLPMKRASMRTPRSRCLG